MKIIKLVIILVICINLVGFDTDDILNDDSDNWKIDYDNDDLPNALEDIIGTDKYDKDSNNNLINDKDELEGVYRYNLNKEYINTNNYNKSNKCISDYDLLNVSSMASEKIYIDYIGKKVNEVFGDKYNDLGEFEIVRYEDGKYSFGAIAIRKDNNILIGYKPTRTYKDWIENFTIQFMPHPQRKYAIEFIKPLVNENDNIYITGHSLGGLLAQYSTYQLYNEGYKNIKTVTFNSASILNPKHMKGKYGPPILKPNFKKEYKESYFKLIPEKQENNIIIDASYLVDFLNKSIRNNGFIDINNKAFIESDFREYNDIVTNYIMSNDPIYLIINGEYLGNKKVIDTGKENIDFIKDRDKLEKYHELKNFINVLK